VDPWLWLALGTGVLFSGRKTGPARLALTFLGVYAAAMALSGMAARRAAVRELAKRAGEPTRLMLGPLPVTPFVRTMVAEQEDTYLLGRFRWLASPPFALDSVRSYPRGDRGHPAVLAASSTTLGRRFLTWARFPAFQVEPVGSDRFVVHIVDLRYADRPGVRFGAVSIPVTLPHRH
jgi:hypothetical protein